MSIQILGILVVFILVSIRLKLHTVNTPEINKMQKAIQKTTV